MRYNSSTDQARTLEALAAQSREAIRNCPASLDLGYVWSPDQLAYVPTGEA
mgnify:CR=1 FL=1|jgi:hypothetical protein